MRTVISWSRGQGVGQWGVDEADLEEALWSLWSANNDIIDDFDKKCDSNLNQDDHEDDANQLWTFIYDFFERFSEEKKLQHNFPKMRGGGQRPIGIFLKIHPLW